MGETRGEYISFRYIFLLLYCIFFVKLVNAAAVMSRFIDCFVLVLFILTFMHLVALLGGLKEISTWELSQRLKECWKETEHVQWKLQ